MRDVTLREIITEIENEFPVKVPRFIIYKIVRYALRVLFRELRKPRRQFNFIRSDIVKIYEIDTGEYELGAAMDLDETRVPNAKEYKPVLRKDYYKTQIYYAKGEPTETLVGFRGNRKRRTG